MIGGEGLQHSPTRLPALAPVIGTASSVLSRLAGSEPRWTIQIWSRESTATPIAWPSTQLLGMGLGQNGSTSKRGASLPCAIACLNRNWPEPSAAITARKLTPTSALRLQKSCLILLPPSPFSRQLGAALVNQKVTKLRSAVENHREPWRLLRASLHSSSQPPCWPVGHCALQLMRCPTRSRSSPS